MKGTLALLHLTKEVVAHAWQLLCDREGGSFMTKLWKAHWRVRKNLKHQ